MAQGQNPKPTATPVTGPAGPSQLDALLPNPPPPYEAATRIEAGGSGNDVVVDGRSYRSRVNSRFFKAWFWGVVVWILVSGLFRSYYEILWPRHRHRNHINHGADLEVNEWTGSAIPDDVTVGPCQEWSSRFTHDKDLPFVGEAHLDLPLDSESLLFISRGPLTDGRLQITTDSRIPSDRVHVNVTIRSLTNSLQNFVNICSASRNINDHGVVIFTPSTEPQSLPKDKRFMLLETTLTFPSGQPKVVKSLEVDMPNTAQTIGNLSDYLFNHLNILTSNSPVDVEELHVNNGTIETSWGPIKGNLNTSGVLALKTSMAPILVDIGATSDGDTTQVVLSTTASPLQANISLLSGSSSTRGVFKVSASNAHDIVDVKFPTQPLNSTLHFSGSTENAKASVTLDPAYEGKINLRTSIRDPSYNLREPTLDPSRRKRRRHVDLRLDDKTLVGEVEWVDGQHEPKGEVVLNTTNADCIMVL